MAKFPSSIFAAVSYNFGPRTVCFNHTDFADPPFKWCAVAMLVWQFSYPQLWSHTQMFLSRVMKLGTYCSLSLQAVSFAGFRINSSGNSTTVLRGVTIVRMHRLLHLYLVVTANTYLWILEKSELRCPESWKSHAATSLFVIWLTEVMISGR